LQAIPPDPADVQTQDIDTMHIRSYRRLAPVLAVAALSGCASLGAALQPPSFRVDGAQQAQLRLLPPSSTRPSGGASVRLFARVGNPNPVGITLTTLAGDLELGGRGAARVDFPLGVPLAAGGETVVPLDISVNFADIPGLGSTLLNAITGRPLEYRLVGSVGVDAGILGRPTFGPMALLSGEVRVTR
jgi:hypothetical protein